VVVDPEVLIEEIDYLESKGIAVGPDMLMISDRAHVIMPYHKLVDHGREKMKGDKKIGTTGRGIGPSYEDKATRRGVRFVDLNRSAIFSKSALRPSFPEKNFYLEKFLDTETVDSKKSESIHHLPTGWPIRYQRCRGAAKDRQGRKTDFV
jgi:adenylosuccinate synthase